MNASHVCQAFHITEGRLNRRVNAGAWHGISSIAWDGVTHDSWDSAVARGAVVQQSPSPTPLRIVDLFSGCGGLTRGLFDAARSVGLNPSVEIAVDFDRPTAEVHTRNFNPKRSLITNLWEVVDVNISGRGSPAQFAGQPAIYSPEIMDLRGSVDVIVGGPPCQGRSTANNHTRFDDSRNVLYLVMPAVAVALGAPVLIIENVMNIYRDQSQVVQTTRAVLEKEGYEVVDSVVDCLRIGVPQTRKRHILVAVKGHRPLLEEALAALSEEPRSVGWAIKDLLGIKEETIFDRPAQLSPTNRERIRYLFDHAAYEMPNHIRPDSHKDGHTYPSVYGRLRWDQPAGTITTGFHTPGRGRYIHPLEQRTLTPHEAARIQGFPDSFKFRLADGSTPARQLLAQCIGDAVPPKLGYAAALAALAALDPAQLSNAPVPQPPPLRVRRRLPALC